MRGRRGAAAVAVVGIVAGLMGGTAVPAAAETRDWSLPSTNAQPTSIVRGPDGAMWVAEYGVNKLARVGVGGARSEFALKSQEFASRNVDEVYRGPGNAVYVNQGLGTSIGRLDVKTKERCYFAAYNQAFDQAYGPLGRIWYADSQLAGFKPGAPFRGVPGVECAAVATAPGGIVWCAVEGKRTIVRFDFTPSFSAKTFTLPLRSSLSWDHIAVAKDGAVWMTASVENTIHGVLVRRSPSGTVQTWRAHGWANGRPTNLMAGSGDWMYFPVSGDALVRVNATGTQQVARLGARNVEDVAFDARGRAWTIDFSRSRITRSSIGSIFGR